ncbi:DUF2797 domain-containing protein [Candidatus Micrarchaeota archaeon]|nr:DUF2797 domain-containing protein [Candidatus Micrarchaeota archaeon]
MLIERVSYSDEWVPQLHIGEKTQLLEKGSAVDLALHPEVHCLGYSRSGQRHVCPETRIGRKQCSSCAKEDDFLVCLRCDGATCLQFNSQLKDDCFGKEYSVYLASFGQTVKAGISKTSRLEKRWVEQGADFALEAFSGLNGQKARVIESALFRTGLAARIVLGDKMKLPKPDGTLLKDELEQPHIRRVRDAFPENSVEKPVQSLQRHYPDSLDARPTPTLQGTVTGWKGPVLFLQQNGERRVFGLPDAVGRKINAAPLSAYF